VERSGHCQPHCGHVGNATAADPYPGDILGQEVLGREDFDADPYSKYDVILVDESHNFRNRDSGRYENLSRLIGLNGGRGEHGYRKKLILMTALRSTTA